MTCTVIQQGYGPPTRTITDCLPHTGTDLWPFLAFGLAIVLLGIYIWLLASRLR